MLLLRRPAHPVSWLFTALATAIGTWGLSDSYGLYGMVVRRGLPGAAAAAVLANSLFIVVFALLALVCSLTPDGRHLSNRWRRASHAMVAVSSVWFALRLVSPQPLDEPFASVSNPWAFTAVDLGAVRWVLATASMLLVLGGPLSLVVRSGAPTTAPAVSCAGSWCARFRSPR